MKLTATRSYTYAGKRLRAGESFEASNQDGKLLVLLGRAEAAKPEPAKAEPVDFSELGALRARAEALGLNVDLRWREARLRSEIGRYSTRHLRAEE